MSDEFSHAILVPRNVQGVQNDYAILLELQRASEEQNDRNEMNLQERWQLARASESTHG